MEISKTVARACVANGGVISFRLADSHGIGEQALIRHWRSGHLRKILPGVFCDRTAIWLYGLSATPDRVEMATPTERQPEVDWLTTRKVTKFGDLDLRAVGSYTVTSPCRTLIDAGRLLGKRELEDLSMMPGERACSLLSRSRNIAHGTARRDEEPAQLRKMAADRMGLAPTDSRLEARTVRLIRRWRLKEPLRQVVVHDRYGARIKRMDLVYPDERIIIECDSFAHHNSDHAFHGDRDIWNRAEDAGYRIQWATWKNTQGDGRRFIKQLMAKLSDISILLSDSDSRMEI